MITEETIARMKQNLEVKNEFFVLDVIKHLEAQIENYKLSENESKEIIAELKGKLKKEQNLNKVIKERLVEVNCDCNAEKKEKCVMFPEYCEGERKTVVDLMSLVSDGLNESLIKQKDKQIELLAKRITELQADKGRLIDENSLTRVLIDRCKELGIKDLYHLKDLLELAE